MILDLRHTHTHICACVCVAWSSDEMWCEKKTKELWECCRILSLMWYEWCIGHIHFSVWDQSWTAHKCPVLTSFCLLSKDTDERRWISDVIKRDNRPFSSHCFHLTTFIYHFPAIPITNGSMEIYVSLRSLKCESKNMYFSIKLLTISKSVIF